MPSAGGRRVPLSEGKADVADVNDAVKVSSSLGSEVSTAAIFDTSALLTAQVRISFSEKSSVNFLGLADRVYLHVITE